MTALTARLGPAARYGDIFLALGVIGIVLLLVIPLPPILLDVLISISLILGVTTLLITIYTEEAIEFNAFPSLLLFLTIFRLAINIASTRMILSEAEAGDIIKTFGEFVTGGSQVVGLVIFILLTVINFVVITKGSGRVAEVAARFTLDAMPGKQMSIDADLNAGVIDEGQARARREKVTAEADFYGAMDGASKFVRGDAIAGIIITIVNVMGGFAIGVASKGMPWQEAIDTYMTLSIGDGLVSQLPALLISVGAGIIVTRASSKENLSKALGRQMFNNPRVLGITSFVIGILALVPGMPMLVMMPIAGGIGAYAWVLYKASVEVPEFDPLSSVAPEEASTDQSGSEVEKVLFVDPMEVELGYGLIPLVDQAQGGDLLSRITLIRRQIASELGIVVPPIRIRDNMALDAERYIIKIKGIEVAEGSLYVDSFLAMNPGNISKTVSGIDTTEPAFGLPATWISAAQKETAEMYGYTVVDTLSVLATHLTEIIHSHADELVNRQETQRLIDNAKTFASAVIEELIPNQMTLGQVLRVLQNLLRERVPVRDIVTVLESLADHSATVSDSDVLTEYVRQSLARTISKQYVSSQGVIEAITLDPKVEQMLLESVQKSDFGTRIVVRPSTVQKIIEDLHKHVEEGVAKGVQPVALTTPAIRPYFRQMIERSLPRLPVLSLNELSTEMEIQSLGVISSDVLM
jgi:flagellar biosynthesis protein FlhA